MTTLVLFSSSRSNKKKVTFYNFVKDFLRKEKRFDDDDGSDKTLIQRL